ncbi:MAG TPA: hypothetical protein VGM32_16405 [Rhodopila sp.]|jgi:hypothetical protein
MNLANLLPRRIAATGFPRFGLRRRRDRKLQVAAKVRRVAFMHVPKTSGVAIRSGLAAALTPNVTVSGFDRCSFDAYQDFESVDPSISGMIYSSPASLPPRADLIVGHFAFSTLRQAYPDAQLLTLLREPCSRLLSHWLFWRQHTDAELAPWGCLAERVRKARQPIAVFLNDPGLSCQTDNLMLRMLLWPHPLLPSGRFIDPLHDARLLRQAMANLQEFDFVDVVENGAVGDRLQSWLCRPFIYPRANETRPIPQQFRTPLDRELTPEVMDLLEFRSRLDFHLWAAIARLRFPGRDISKLRHQTIIKNVARYGVLMAC